MKMYERIQKAREYAAMGKAELCQALSIDLTELEAWESGEREPSLAQMSQMCEVLHVSSEFLLSGKDPEGVFGEKHCISCGTVLPKGVKYCPQCGQMVPAAGTDPAAVSQAHRSFCAGRTYTLVIQTNRSHRDQALYGIQLFFENGEYHQNSILPSGMLISGCSPEELIHAQESLSHRLLEGDRVILCRNMPFQNVANILDLFQNRANVYVYYDEDGTTLEQLMQATPIKMAESVSSTQEYKDSKINSGMTAILLIIVVILFLPLLLRLMLKLYVF